MTVNGKTLIRRFNDYCPEWLTETGDPVGLRVGTLDKPIGNVMVTLDVHPEVVAEVIEKQVDLATAKYSPTFRLVRRLAADNFQEEMHADLLKYNIAVYAACTNMDIVDNGLNDWFCKLLGVKQTTFLTKTHTVPCKKLAVPVPVGEAPQMRETLGLASTVSQSDYSKTSYSLVGTGCFTSTQGANPTIDEVGQESVVQKAEIEVIFPETKQEQVLATVLQAHLYEGLAYDAYTIENQSKEFSLGRAGVLDKPMRFSCFIQQVEEALQLDDLWVITKGDTKMTQWVIICGGSNERFYHDALRKQVDAYITGDMYYHMAHDVIAEDLPVTDPGHYIEAFCRPELAKLMNQWKRGNE